MKICKSNRVITDDFEQIYILEEQTHLSTDHIYKLFNDKVVADRTKTMRGKFTAVIAACIILFVTINWKHVYTFASEFFVKDRVTSQSIVLPEVNMNLITVNKPEKFDYYGVYTGTKYYTSLKNCTDELGINILTSDLAYDEEYEEKVVLWYPLDGDEKFGSNSVNIMSYLYIIGDLKEFERQGTGAGYKYPQTEDDKYASPISLNIDFFITGTKKKLVGSNEDYSGLSYNYHETYTGSNGIEAQIIGNNNSARINNYTAIFYDSNIKYTLKGDIKLLELKRIIDSFH